MPLPLTVSCFSKIQLVFFTFWYQPTWVVLDKGPLNGCVYVCHVSLHRMTIIATWKHVSLSCFLGHRRCHLNLPVPARVFQVLLITDHRRHLIRTSSSSSQHRRHGDTIDDHTSAHSHTVKLTNKWWMTKNFTLCLEYRLSLSLSFHPSYLCFYSLFFIHLFPEWLQLVPRSPKDSLTG